MVRRGRGLILSEKYRLDFNRRRKQERMKSPLQASVSFWTRQYNLTEHWAGFEWEAVLMWLFGSADKALRTRARKCQFTPCEQSASRSWTAEVALSCVHVLDWSLHGTPRLCRRPALTLECCIVRESNTSVEKQFYWHVKSRSVCT